MWGLLERLRRIAVNHYAVANWWIEPAIGWLNQSFAIPAVLGNGWSDWRRPMLPGRENAAAEVSASVAVKEPAGALHLQVTPPQRYASPFAMTFDMRSSLMSVSMVKVPARSLRLSVTIRARAGAELAR